ncbi:MAG: polyprenyl synthetase family protein [Treponema sp.]|nr:polyprenyl synthetase family protein [Treponema sp.]
MNKYTQRLEKIEVILNKNLPEFFDNDTKKRFFSQLPDAVESKHIQPLIAPCRELFLLGGKRRRPLLQVLCAELFTDESSKNMQAVYEAVPLVEFVHTASLIHDDIEDSADTRRGKPAAYLTYGLDTALNAGSWLYFASFVSIENLEISEELKLKLYRTANTELRRLHLGQAMDIEWHRNNNYIPTREEYESMVRCKTGTLASLASKTGSLIAGATDKQADELGALSADIGVGFQVLDDVINLSTGNPGKKRGDDIVEGKKSLPVIIHLETYPEDFEKIKDYFTEAGKNGINSPAVEKCIELLTNSGAVNKARIYSSELIEKSLSSIKKTYGSKEASALIAELFRSMLKN